MINFQICGNLGKDALLNQKIEDMKNPYFNSISLISEVFLDPSSVLILSKPIDLL